MNRPLPNLTQAAFPSGVPSRYRRNMTLSEAFRSVQRTPLKAYAPDNSLSVEQTLVFRLAALIFALVLAALFICASIAHADEPTKATPSGGHLTQSTASFGAFGTVHLYSPAATPTQLVLFISGDGGWNLGVVDMARALAQTGALVAGIDITHYIKVLNAGKDKCSYAASDFEGLSQYLQKKYGFQRYAPPVLVGYSSGATMVYTVLAQSPDNTFAGGISLGFCPDLKTVKPFCPHDGKLSYHVDKKLGFIYNPVERLASPWGILQGDTDKVCSTPDTEVFVAKVKGADIIALPKVGHGFSVEKNWMPQFLELYRKITAAPVKSGDAATPVNGALPPTETTETAADVSDLPLVELPAKPGNTPSGNTTPAKPGRMAIVVSGDGGWASIDKQIGKTLNGGGMPVVGVNALQYFWQKKDPDIAGRDLARIMTHYAQSWNATNFVLVGYSRGADVLPFMVSRLPADLKAKIDVLALLGLDTDVDFEFQVGDWVADSAGSYKVLPEIKKLSGGVKVLCLYGAEETDTACKTLDQSTATSIKMEGGHHFGGDYEKLASVILGHIN